MSADKAQASGPEAFLDRLVSEGRMPGGRGGDKLRSFMAHADQIRGALQAGFSIKDVWGSLKAGGEVDLSYAVFADYVRTKLHLRPRAGFEPVGGDRKEASEPKLSVEQKRCNLLIHGNPGGIPLS